MHLEKRRTDRPRHGRQRPTTLLAFAGDDGLTYIFAGTNRDAILRDTRDGTRFAFATLRCGTELRAEEVERTSLPFYQRALDAVARARRDRRSLSYLVGAALNIGQVASRRPARLGRKVRPRDVKSGRGEIPGRLPPAAWHSHPTRRHPSNSSQRSRASL
jgi:hypothetical protein